MIKHKRQNPDNQDEFWCSDCETYKHRSEYHRHKRRANGIAGICKQCSNKRWSKSYYEKKETHQHIRSTRMETISRSEITGFIKYYSQRPEAFQIDFNMQYSQENAKRAFRQAKFD